MPIRAWLASWTWPLVMATSVAGALWGFERGYDPGTWSFVGQLAQPFQENWRVIRGT